MRRALHLTRRRSREEGASLVEFALILPIFALLLFGFIDFGLIFGGFITLRSGVNAGARNASVAAVNPTAVCQSPYDSNPMLCTVDQDIGSLTGVSPGSLQISIDFPPGSGGGSEQVGDPVRVCAQATLSSATGITGAFVDGDVMHSVSVLRLEQDPTWADGSSYLSSTAKDLCQ